MDFPSASQVAPEPQPLLHLGAGEVHDGPLVSFLLQRALQERREEEEERRMLEEQEELNFLRAVPPERRTPQQVQRTTDVLKQRWAKRKRKKRRKRRTPRTSSRSLRGRARRRQRRHARFASFAVMFLFALCSLRLTTGPRCLASWLVWTRRTVFHDYGALIVDSGMCRAGFTILLALYSFFLPSWHLGRYGPEGQLLRARRRYGSGLCMAGIPGSDAFALYSL